MSDNPKKSLVTLKGGKQFSLLNPNDHSIDRLISDFVDMGVKYEETSGCVSWYPSTAIQMIYFEYE